MAIAELIEKFQKSCRAAFLATVDGGSARVRPVSPVGVEGNIIWIASYSWMGKMAQVAANPNVELCYMDEAHAQLRLRGRCEICSDQALKRRMWDAYPLMQRYFKGLDDPEYALLKLTVAEACTMPATALKYTKVEL